MARELPKIYDPSEVESSIYNMWESNGYFHAERDENKKPYTIVMPPPNVTGQLHMGHAVDNTMQDILIRAKRMQGNAALWLPGTDHASIATEAKVVEAMAKEGLTKDMLGRAGFLERAVRGNEYWWSIGISQIISNVPASIVLWPFTADLRALIYGLDTAGLVTVIGSLASVINLRLYTREYPGQGKAFMICFEKISLCFFAIVVVLLLFLL